MKFTDVSPLKDLCRNSLRNQEQYIVPRKNRFNYNWTYLFLDSLVYLAVIECRDWKRMNTRQLYWFTPMSYIQSSPNPMWNSLKHNSNNYKHHCSWTLQEHWHTCWKTLFQHTHSSRNPIKKSLQSHFYTNLKYEMNTPDRGCRNLP